MSRKNISDRITRAAIGRADGDMIELRTARARVAIVRMESDRYTGVRYFLQGDSIPGAPTQHGYLRPLEALRAALDTLATFNGE